MDWIKFENEVRKLSSKIDFKPDIIVGIARGGLIPSRLLSSLLKIKDVYCVTVKKNGSRRIVVTEIKENFKNKKILLVEDVLETGKSLIAAKNYLESRGAVVKTCCLYFMPYTEIKPDYYLEVITKLVKFPWD